MTGHLEMDRGEEDGLLFRLQTSQLPVPLFIRSAFLEYHYIPGHMVGVSGPSVSPLGKIFSWIPGP